MQAYWDVLLEALEDTAKMLLILFVCYYLIELLEFKFAEKFSNNRFLKGKASPVFGSLIGSIPQCGFSVVSTDLYVHKKISIGALIAVYVATSDEAIPLMFSYAFKEPAICWKLFLLVGVKIVLGIAIGYLAMGLYKAIFKKQNDVVTETAEEHAEHVHMLEHGGCCHHNVENNKFDWLHPLLHCLKIGAFMLVVNILFGCITDIWIGEDALKNFLSQSLYLQPMLAVLIGLIPNCASSFVLTEFFLMGGLSFGALVAGLCVNAGLGIIMLLKEHKNWKENLFIILTLVCSSLVVGYALLPIII
ncbi:MAG: arsenic efflux protein [Clostridia bacterium]|nr:arsenic efflux protein [Clostridia bacterium]